MKKITILASMAAALMLSFTAVAQSTYTMDKAHSSVGFTITHLSISDIDGSFKTFDAKLTSSKEDFSDATFDFTADVNSINSDNDKRDGHLKSPDFFDVAKFATLTFKSKTVKKGEGNKYTIIGDMTMHGVTKMVSFDAVIRSGVNPMSKKTVVGVKVSGTVNRSTFGIGATMPGTMLSEDVIVRGSAEFSKN
ncbi:MAG TPA: YceI family protein [Bacteroidia bacterium]|nr:YceI family protein [Bacteroidia bacterium]